MARMWSRTRALRLAQRTPVILLANALLRAAGTLVFIFVGRISGPEDAGVLSLALGYLAILTTLFTGLDDLLIREVTAAPKRVTALLLAYAVLRLPPHRAARRRRAADRSDGQPALRRSNSWRCA